MDKNLFAIGTKAIRTILGIRRMVPTTLEEMASSLAVVFAPGTLETPRLRDFGVKLRAALSEVGARVLEIPEAGTTSGHLREGVVVIYLGESPVDFLSQGDLPVRNLYSNPTVGIFDRPSPVEETDSLQSKLLASAGEMTDHLVTTCIYVTDRDWTLSTLNGAVIKYRNGSSITADLLNGFVPKVAARPMPPGIAGTIQTSGTFDPLAEGLTGMVDDFIEAARIWERDGAMSAHVSLDSLRFRGTMHRALIASYLEERSGMSYGFLAWQLPLVCGSALTPEEAGHLSRDFDGEGLVSPASGEGNQVMVRVGGREYFCPVPDVSVVCTRSGCRKDRIDPGKDLMKISLNGGRILLQTPAGAIAADGCQPSYDTLTILAHAVGNSLVASLLKRMNPGSRFLESLETRGLSLCHWHGYLPEDCAPDGYVRHGEDNPGVCCATRQSAIYSLAGKLEAFGMGAAEDREYLGDVHVEPHHGTNLCGILSLHDAAAFALRGEGSLRRT